MTLSETKKMLGTVTVFAMAWAVMIASLFWLNADCQAQGDHARRTLWMRDCTKTRPYAECLRDLRTLEQGR